MWHMEPGEERRTAHVLRPEAIAVRDERRARLGELERAHDPPAVVPVNRRRRRRVEVREARERAVGVGIVRALPPLTCTGLRSGRHAQVDEGGAKVQSRPPDDRRSVRLHELVDRRVCEPGELAHRHLLR